MSVRERSEDGASAVEYGLIVFAIAAMVALIVFSLGVVNQAMFTDSCQTIKDGFDNAGHSTPDCS